MKEVIEHLERMAETLDGVDEENWLDTPQDIVQIYRSVANEIRQKMSAQINTAAIHDALKRILDETNRLVYSIDDIRSWAESALAKPPRNCDVIEGRNADDEFEKAMGYPPSKTADERDELMRENWFLFKLWLFAEAKGESNA